MRAISRDRDATELAGAVRTSCFRGGRASATRADVASDSSLTPSIDSPMLLRSFASPVIRPRRSFTVCSKSSPRAGEVAQHRREVVEHLADDLVAVGEVVR